MMAMMGYDDIVPQWSRVGWILEKDVLRQIPQNEESRKGRTMMTMMGYDDLVTQWSLVGVGVGQSPIQTMERRVSERDDYDDYDGL